MEDDWFDDSIVIDDEGKMSRRENILKIASQKLRNYGYNGFSYGDIAKEIGITTASLHYHFPAKEDLAIALCESIQTRWQETLEALNREGNLPSLVKLERFVSTNANALQPQEICPMVAFISSYETLPPRLKVAVSTFTHFEYQLFLNLIEEAIENGELSASIDPHQCTAQIISMIKGALLYRRIEALPTDHFNHISNQLKLLLNLWKRESDENR